MHHGHSPPVLTLALALSFSVTPITACGGSGADGQDAAGDGIPGTTTQTPDESTETAEDEDSGTTDAPDSSGSDTETTGDTETPEEEEEEEDGEPLINFDLAPVPDSPPYDESCGMVDFLFVIDNSGSMYDEQIALINNFPTFINGIETTLVNVDTINVGVTTTDNYFANVGGCQQIGSLVVQTGGSDSSNSVCGPYDQGANFMTEEDDLGAKFSCAAQVGTGGSADERPMEAMVNAVTGVYGGEDQCNEAFIRDDALLVIVIITDENDTNSIGNTITWYQDVVDAKGGYPENVVVLSLINTPGGNCGWDVAQNIADFTMMFGVNGFMADICLPDYAPVFDEAVEIINVACDNYLTN
jgi:hypothetical protein